MTRSFRHVHVFGAGAIGSWLGARLSVPATLVARGEHARIMRERGLRILGCEDDLVAVSVIEEIPAPGPDALILVCVKTGGFDAVAEALRFRLRRDTIVAVVANGLHPDRDLAARIDHPVVRIIAGFGATLDAPGVVSAWGGKVQLGRGRAEDRVADVLAGTGLTVERIDDLLTVAWEKFALNCVANPLAGLTGLRNRHLVDGRFLGIRQAVVREVAAVAETEGVRLSVDLAGAIDAALARSSNLNSMAQDMRYGRTTEIDDLNGLVVKKAEQAGVEVPVNRFLTEAIRLRQMIVR